MHQRRASESLGVEVPDMIEKGKWMFNPGNQSSHEESHTSMCQSRYKVTWRSKMVIDHTI
jgi:hypothetical protein